MSGVGGQGSPRPTPDPRLPTPGFRSGFVVLAGRPNVGKSTLVNRLVGQKVAITAPVPQTTRSRLSGIVNRPNAQVVLVDTPGLHQPRHALGKRMVEVAKRALSDADAVLLLVDATGLTPEDRPVIAALGGVRAPVVVALNKADRADPGAIAATEADVRARLPAATTLPVSAATGANLDRLVDALVGLLPGGPQYFPPEMVTDQPEQSIVRELIREQALHLTRDEVPHGVAVEIEEFTPRPGKGLVYIRATIHVERDSHKKILIGKDGRRLAAIGHRARREVEALLGSRVYLDLWVKTTRRWRERPDLVHTFYPE